MREARHILLAMFITSLAACFAVPAAGFDIKTWVLILSALISGLFAGLLVMLGETVIEDLVKIAIVLCLTGVLWGSKPGLGFVFVSALVSCVVGAIFNQIHQYTANRRRQHDPPPTTHIVDR